MKFVHKPRSASMKTLCAGISKSVERENVYAWKITILPPITAANHVSQIFEFITVAGAGFCSVL